MEPIHGTLEILYLQHPFLIYHWCIMSVEMIRCHAILWSFHWYPVIEKKNMNLKIKKYERQIHLSHSDWYLSLIVVTGIHYRWQTFAKKMFRHPGYTDPWNFLTKRALVSQLSTIVVHYKMAGRAFLVAKEVFHHRNGNILKLWEWLNDEKQFFYHSKLRYTEPWNFLTKRALVSQQSTIVVAKDSNISHYLNLLVNSPTIILLII